MSRPIIREHNLATNEVIDREMTDLEFAEYQENELAIEAAQQAKNDAKSALLEKLGITEEEAKLLLG